MNAAALQALAALAEDHSCELLIVRHGGLPVAIRACRVEAPFLTRVQGIRCLRNLSFNMAAIAQLRQSPDGMAILNTMVASPLQELAVRVSLRNPYSPCSPHSILGRLPDLI